VETNYYTTADETESVLFYDVLSACAFVIGLSYSADAIWVQVGDQTEFPPKNLSVDKMTQQACETFVVLIVTSSWQLKWRG